MMASRAMTEDEVRTTVLQTVAEYVDYWERETRVTDLREKLEGLAFSILVILDGGAGLIPGFKVTPNPHPDDEAYHRKEGTNWWPTDVDIAGELHERIHTFMLGGQ